MSAPLNRLARLAIASAILGIPLLAGCDSATNQADRKAASAIAEAESKLARGEEAETAIQLLSTAGGDTQASPTTRMRANSLLGQVLMQEARKIAWNVDRLARDSQKLSMEIAQLCGEAQFANQLAIGYKLLDPTPIVNNLTKQADDARGGADRTVWFETDGIKFETLAAVSQEVSKLEGEIARLQQQITALEGERDAALAAAEAAAREAESSSDRASVEAFKRASDARKKAADLGTQIEVQSAALEPMVRDLAIATARKDYVSDAAKAMEEQGAAMQNSWVTIQKAAGAQQALVKSIASGTEAGGPIQLTLPEGVNVKVDALPAASIAEKAAKLAEIEKQADEQRAAAMEKLNAAQKHLADAVAAADIARKDVELAKSDHPGAAVGQIKAWDASRNTLSAATYRVRQAAALQLLAELHASHAASLDLRRKLQALVSAALRGTGVTPPTELSSEDVQAKWEQAMKEADEAYKSADELLDTVLQAGQNTDAEKAAVEAARISRIFELYNWSILSAEMGATDQAKAQMDLAKSTVADAVANAARLPPLPPELAAAAAAAAPKPEPAAPPDVAPPAEGQPADAPPAQPPAEGQPPGEGQPPAEGQPPVEQPPADQPPQTPPGGGPG